MNFYNEDENEKKEGAPALPRAASPFKKTSAFGKTPLFSRTAGSLMDRLKNLSRRDMALVGLGLSVLVMVPVAEYMMSQPPQENLLEGGWGGKEKLGDMPYEPGVNGLSQGSADGSGEVITPLSSRDPVSLILGSQPAQPAVSAPVYTPPATSMRDAMRDAGREAFSAASKSAGAPTVIPKMAGGLRNMSFFGGGESSRTSGNLGGGKIIDEARSASSKAAKRSMVGPVAIAGYKGVASTPNSASKGAFEKLRAAADKSAGNFSGGSAIRSLDKAAADALEIGKGGGGMGAGGDSDKTGKTSGNSVKGYEHNRSGESLAEQAAKMRQQKALEWEFYKKYEIPKQIINAVVGAVSNVIGEFIKDKLMSAFGLYPPNIKCWNPAVCPDGVSCESKADKYLGPNWWTGPNKKDITALCSAVGKPVPIKVVVGKESAASNSEVCICGKGEKPTIGGSSSSADATAADPGANPGGDVNATPQHHAQAALATMKSYDEQVRVIVEKVAEAETLEAAKIDQVRVDSLVDAFQRLAPLADGKIRTLGEKKDAAESSLTAFNSDLSGAITKHDQVKPKYDSFEEMWSKLDKECPKGAALADCKIKLKSAAGIQVAMDEKSKSAIRTALDQWSTSGRIYYGTGRSQLNLMRRFGVAYNKEIPKLTQLMEEIRSAQGGIVSSVSQMNSKGSPLLKMKNLSGRLEKLQETAAAPTTGAQTQKTGPDTAAVTGGDGPVAKEDTPLYKIAVGQRGADWDILWQAKHDIDATKVSQAEATAFGNWEEGVRNIPVGVDPLAHPIPDIQVTPKTMVDYHMRATELSRSATVSLVNIKDINTNMDRTVAAMDTVKGILQNLVDPSYLPAGGSVKPDEKPADDVTDTVPGGQVGDQTSGKPSKLTWEINRSNDALNDISGQVQSLEDIPGDKDYTKYRKAAQTAKDNAVAALKDMRAAQARLASATTPADKEKAQADYDAAKEKFRTESGKAKGSLQQAQLLLPGALRPSSAPNQYGFNAAQQEKARSEARLLSQCEDAVGGFASNAQGKCSIARSGRVTGLTASIDTNLGAEETLKKYSTRIGIACDFVRQCASLSGSRVVVPAGCSGRTSR